MIFVTLKLVSLDRSLTTLEVMGESSLMTILRWNFKTNMEKMICSSNRGQIILVSVFSPFFNLLIIFLIFEL